LIQVLTAVVMKTSVSWNITPCSLLKVNGCFGGIFSIHLQGRRLSKERSQREKRTKAGQKLTYSPETPVDFQQTTWSYIPEDRHHIQCIRSAFRETKFALNEISAVQARHCGADVHLFGDCHVTIINHVKNIYETQHKLTGSVFISCIGILRVTLKDTHSCLPHFDM
jgi:hypothetical protein